MSMYGFLFGKNPNSKIILGMLGLTEIEIERFRDCYIDTESDEIIILTRTGGYNRLTSKEYDDDLDPEDGTVNSDLTAIPGYLRDLDDDFDNTYAKFYFKIPEKYKEMAKQFSTKGEKLSEQFNSIIDEIKTMTPQQLEMDLRFKPIVELLKGISDDYRKGDHQA